MAQPRTVFLDRDGVINRKAPKGDYVKRWEEFEFLPGAREALALLTLRGFRTIVVTNQRGIARGLMTEGDLTEIHRRMARELAAVGARLDAIYYCPHEHGTCACRKPAIGLFERARDAFPDIDFSSAYMIGDSSDDMEAGRRAGCRTILVSPRARKLRLTAEAGQRGSPITYIAASLHEAVTECVLQSKHSTPSANR